MDLLRAYELKLTENLTDTTYQRFPQAFPKHNIASLKVTRARVEFLAQFKPQPVDCCIDNCMAFTGANADATACTWPGCGKARYTASGKPRRRFNSIPLIPRLLALYESKDKAQEMSYRENYAVEEGVFKDVFDGGIYRTLREQNVTIGGVEHDHKFFDSGTDIALGFSCDGFSPFKNGKQTCWPLLLVNYNLPPDDRFKIENLICVGVIPGPNKPKDLDSFLWLVVMELIRLAIGIKAFHNVLKRFFILRAYLILASGDLPAVAMMLLTTGHNGVFPCRSCTIRGILKPGTTKYYYPHKPPKDYKPPAGTRQPLVYDPSDLPLRSHSQFIKDGLYSQSAPNPTQAKKRAQESGVKGVPLLSQLPSMYCPLSFPFDFMHLVYENVIKNLIQFWCGTYRDLNHDDEDYSLDLTVWRAIGKATQEAGRTTPGAYRPAIPDLSEDGVRITADMYSFWAQFLGPVLLEKAFPKRRVYEHFVKLVTIITRCLRFSITLAELGVLRQDIIDWVETYEKCVAPQLP